MIRKHALLIQLIQPTDAVRRLVPAAQTKPPKLSRSFISCIFLAQISELIFLLQTSHGFIILHICQHHGRCCSVARGFEADESPLCDNVLQSARSDEHVTHIPAQSHCETLVDKPFGKGDETTVKRKQRCHFNETVGGAKDDK